MTPTEAITALEKALEAGPTPGAWRTDPDYSSDVQTADGRLDLCTAEAVGYQFGKGYDTPSTVREAHANAAFIAAANPLAIRTLLDAHAGALRDAERYAAIRSLGWTVNIDHCGDPDSIEVNVACAGNFARKPFDGANELDRIADAARAARAALATNTKAQP